MNQEALPWEQAQQPEECDVWNSQPSAQKQT